MVFAPEIQISLISNSRKQITLQHEADRGKGAVTKWEGHSPPNLCCGAPTVICAACRALEGRHHHT